MLGLMQDWPLTVDRVLDHARAVHGTRKMVSRRADGGIDRTTYAEVHARAKQVSGAALAAGIRPGDRVGTLAFNTTRHLEAWYGLMGIGAVVHTLNPRLPPEQLAYMIGHAGDRMILADPMLAPLLKGLLPYCKGVETVIWFAEGGDEIGQGFEDWIAGQPADCPWGGFDENTAAGLCYTSGTTGEPKGVLYSHRSNVLHSLMSIAPDVMGISAADTVLPIVPMFHANGWGIAFSAPMVGAKMVMPGARLDGASVYELLETEGVTFSAAVPTVWQMLLQHLESTGSKLSTLKRVVIGGSAVADSLIRAFHDRYGVEVRQGWGMTEMSPLGTVCTPTASIQALPFEDQLPQRRKQGRPPFGVEMRLEDDAGRIVPHDGVTPGKLKVRGPAVSGAYFGRDQDILDADGFFDTGDIACIDGEGVMQITDRAKDLIKSGGEWISSVEIEVAACGHPKVAVAGVIAAAHPKWAERPLLVVQLKPQEDCACDEILAFLAERMTKWQTPDDVVFIEAMPLGPTGKVDKKVLRVRYADHRLPTA